MFTALATIEVSASLENDSLLIVFIDLLEKRGLLVDLMKAVVSKEIGETGAAIPVSHGLVADSNSRPRVYPVPG